MFTRRTFLATSSSTFLASLSLGAAVARAQTPQPQQLRVGTRTLDVRGRAATVLGITDARGRQGLEVFQSDGFNVQVSNGLAEATVIHWHGLTPPFAYDGSNVSQAVIQGGGSHDYQFDLVRAGTNWMHSHHGLQEANLMAAPLIVRADSEREIDRQDVTILLQDFSFTSPEEIFAGLRGGSIAPVGSGIAAMDMGMVRGGDASMPAMDHSQMDMSQPMAGMDHGQMNMTQPMAGMDHSQMDMGAMDLNDVTFDAYLANDRDLTDPEVVQVERGGRVRLRIINAASSTNFWVDLGTLNATLVAVDGMDVRPVFGRRFELAMAQRLDIDVQVPLSGGAFPILAQREGDRTRTGIILATQGAEITWLQNEAETIVAPVLLDLERQLSALTPLAERPVDRRFAVDLTGDMMSYVWGINGAAFGDHAPLDMGFGERVEIVLRNQTMMSHPMHLHGHHFQVVGLGQSRLRGAMRDTVIVPPMESVTIQFDADNAGEWPLHCHNAYHLEAGMMTTVRVG